MLTVSETGNKQTCNDKVSQGDAHSSSRDTASSADIDNLSLDRDRIVKSHLLQFSRTKMKKQERKLAKL
jgi:hypothetical protein